MFCKVQKSKISGKIICPPNKSYTHRAIFLAALAKGKSVIENVLYSADTNATISTCKNFGARITQNKTSLVVENSEKIELRACSIDAANSGTTIRIASAIASLVAGKSTLTGDESLRKRPMQHLLDALESIGARCTSSNGNPPVTIIGKIRGGEVTIPGNISSQFLSALMIAGPFTEKGIVLNIEGELVSKPYLDATIYAMKKFGVIVKTDTPYKKYIIPHQDYKSTNFVVPADFSSLAMLLSAAVLVGEDLQIQATLNDLPQADKAFIAILKELGVAVRINDSLIRVKSPNNLLGGKFDLSNTPDLLPPLAILALKTSKPIDIFNVKHARYKETDRIAIVSRELKKLGLKIVEKQDGLVLEAANILNGAELNSENDHRLFMAFCIAGMYVGNCTVSDPESVKVSYPDFISDMKSVGANLQTP
jgi:3-phosphoshikimate 1-carboxyvinyltransferase